jgi:hypothetical protein
MRQKSVCVNIHLSNKSRFVLEKLGVIDSNGKARRYAAVSACVNRLIESAFCEESWEKAWCKLMVGCLNREKAEVEARLAFWAEKAVRLQAENNKVFK